MFRSNHTRIIVGISIGIVVALVIVSFFGALLGSDAPPAPSSQREGLDSVAPTATALAGALANETFRNANAVAQSATATPAPTATVAQLPETGGGGGDVAEQTEPQPQQRIVIRNANLTITVADPEAKLEQIAAMAEAMGGWVVGVNSSAVNIGGGETGTQGSITVRVPAERLDEALAQIKDGIGKLNSETITGEDVTDQFVDTSSRLRNLQAAEAQLSEILRAAETTEDVLNVYTELVRIRGEIEVAQGRLNYFTEASSFSLVQVTVRPEPVTPPIEVAGWRPQDTVAGAVQTLINLAQGAVDVVITLAIVGLPLALVTYVIVRLGWGVVRRRRTAPSA